IKKERDRKLNKLKEEEEALEETEVLGQYEQKLYDIKSRVAVLMAEAESETKPLEARLASIKRSRWAMPDAPWKKTWPMMAMKRAIQWASTNVNGKGQPFDKVAWTTGEVQIERYEDDLRSKVDRIEWERGTTPSSRSKVKVTALQDGDQVFREHLPLEGMTDINHHRGVTLDDVVGGRMAKQIREEVASGQPRGVFEGDGLSIGDEEMEGFYDRNLANEPNGSILRRFKEGKKAEKVGTVEVNLGEVPFGTGYKGPDRTVEEVEKFRDIAPDVSEGGEQGFQSWKTPWLEDGPTFISSRHTRENWPSIDVVAAEFEDELEGMISDMHSGFTFSQAMDRHAGGEEARAGALLSYYFGGEMETEYRTTTKESHGFDLTDKIRASAQEKGQERFSYRDPAEDWNPFDEASKLTEPAAPVFATVRDTLEAHKEKYWPRAGDTLEE
ncbi:uncharacterized protein METZ01_LOCUS253328, partial [marine metagenome]